MADYVNGHLEGSDNIGTLDLSNLAIDPTNMNLSEIIAPSLKGLGLSIKGYPRAWAPKAYSVEDKVTYLGLEWFANQAITDVHEPPPSHSDKWSKYIPTRIKSEGVNVDDRVTPKLANFTDATALEKVFDWTQGAINPDVFDLASNVATADIANTLYIGQPHHGSGFLNFGINVVYTGSTSENATLKLQYKQNAGSWTDVSSSIFNLPQSGSTRLAYFSFEYANLITLTIADSDTLQFRLKLELPSGITLTNWDFEWNTSDFESTFDWFRYVAVLKTDAYEVKIGDGFPVLIDTSDNSEKAVALNKRHAWTPTLGVGSDETGTWSLGTIIDVGGGIYEFWGVFSIAYSAAASSSTVTIPVLPANTPITLKGATVMGWNNIYFSTGSMGISGNNLQVNITKKSSNTNTVAVVIHGEYEIS